MKKKSSIIWIVVIVFVLIITVGKDFLIKTAVTSFGSKIVGAPIEIGGFSLSLLSQKIRITDFKLYNPPGFPHEPMVYLPEIRLDYDVAAFFGGKLHARLIIVNMKEMVVVINKEGKLNVDSLKIIEEQKKKAQEKKTEEKQEAPPFHIDLMKLTFEKVVVKDYSKSEAPSVQAHDIGFKEKEFKNIDSVPQLATLILWQGVSHTAIKSAGLYAATTLLGVGFLPAGIVGVMVAKDSSKAEFTQSMNNVFNATLEVFKQKGEVKSQDKNAGTIKGKYNGADVTVQIEKGETKKTKAVVSARQFMIPKPDIAGGFIYQLQQILK
jgi:hypothetical protein